MPHKRAKRSVRERKKAEAGADLAPTKDTLSHEVIPKSVARVIFAAKVQKEFKETKKRKIEESANGGGAPRDKKRRKVRGESDQGPGAPSMRILPGESLAHFNRRVENSMRGIVRTAVQSASSVTRKTKKDEAADSSNTSRGEKGSTPNSKSKDDANSHEDLSEKAGINKKGRPTEFQSLSTSTPRRLNDIVQAPPELKKFPRKPKATAGVSSGRSAGEVPTGKRSLRESALSMAQKVMMGEERERAIKMYREMKGRNPG